MTCRQLIIISYQVPKHKSVQRFEERATVVFKAFRAQVRNDYGLAGEVTFHRTAKDTMGQLVRGLEIADTEFEFTLRENEHILIIYDEKVQVAPGGGGTGAEVVSHCNEAATAEGGLGTGGRIDANGNLEGGTGFGGDGYGRTISGVAGKGFGAKVVTPAPGRRAKAGAGYGGELRQKAPDGRSH